MAVGDAYVFPGFLTPVLTQLLFQKPPTTFLTGFRRGKRRKYAGKKSRLKSLYIYIYYMDLCIDKMPTGGHVFDRMKFRHVHTYPWHVIALKIAVVYI